MDQYRVFGNPIEQSRSPMIHAMFAEQTKQHLCYKRQLVPLDSFAEAVTGFAASGGKGANVTVPFKEQARTICDQVSERARLAGAVNTLSFEGGSIIGDNTDGAGLVGDLLANNVEIKNKRILLIGAGGAARGVLLPLLEQQPTDITIVNRTTSKALALVEEFNHRTLQALSFEQSNQMTFDILINATSAGLSNSQLPISEQLLQADSVCYDMMYGSDDTPFIRLAKQCGVKVTLDGLGMLVRQAAESFYVWRGIYPEAAPVLRKLRKEIKGH